MLFARICESELEIDESGRDIYEGDGDFFPFVPIPGGFDWSGGDFFAVGSDGDFSARACRGVLECDCFAIIEAEAGIADPVRVVDSTNEFGVVASENFRSLVR